MIYALHLDLVIDCDTIMKAISCDNKQLLTSMRFCLFV